MNKHLKKKKKEENVLDYIEAKERKERGVSLTSLLFGMAVLSSISLSLDLLLLSLSKLSNQCE